MTTEEAIEVLTQIQYDEKDRVHKGWELWSAKSPRIEALEMAIEALKQPQVIRCKDCKWYEKLGEDSSYGYCHAMKHCHYSKHWEIDIYRTYNEDFFCADAERREEE